MRQPLTPDDIERLEVVARTPEAHREAAETLAGWAAAPHPEDDEEAGPAALLSAAAWHLDRAGDPAGALAMHRRAAAAAGHVPPDPRVYLHAALLRAGEVEEARQLADALRRERPEDPDVYTFMAENFEEAGDLRQAHRWAELGAGLLEAAAAEGLLADEWSTEQLLRTRRRVREALGFPPDDLDAVVPPPPADGAQ
ncbi:tetratricopeptide repeat protein [Geodermatophilus sp. SYSU D00691]